MVLVMREAGPTSAWGMPSRNVKNTAGTQVSAVFFCTGVEILRGWAM